MTQRGTAKKTSQQDWHWSDVIAALHKRGWSLRQLGIEHGYDDGGSLGEAARRPFPKAERIIATTLNLAPHAIWPTRYDEHGMPNRRRGPAPRRPIGFSKDTGESARRNLQAKRG
jgi:Ner family transcriptional regulator